MDKLNQHKLHTCFSSGVSKDYPIVDRHYTITHSDITGEIFLDIGLRYNIKKINFTMRDDVLGNWIKNRDRYILNVYCFVGSYPYNIAKARYEIFSNNLHLALEAIRYGDKALFKAFPFLDNSSIWIHFESTYVDLNKTEYLGKLKDYIRTKT